MRSDCAGIELVYTGEGPERGGKVSPEQKRDQGVKGSLEAWWRETWQMLGADKKRVSSTGIKHVRRRPGPTCCSSEGQPFPGSR